MYWGIDTEEVVISPQYSITVLDLCALMYHWSIYTSSVKRQYNDSGTSKLSDLVISKLPLQVIIMYNDKVDRDIKVNLPQFFFSIIRKISNEELLILEVMDSVPDTDMKEVQFLWIKGGNFMFLIKICQSFKINKICIILKETLNDLKKIVVKTLNFLVCSKVDILL